MHLRYENVNDAFVGLVGELYYGVTGVSVVEENSRNGTVLRISEPVTITYRKPKQRVLFNKARDCNPFFHLFEALWMLAGRNDVAPLVYYNSRMKEFSDDGKTFNGAYGYRWRNSVDWDTAGGPPCFKGDQLLSIAHHLKTNPNSRRAVLQMWTVEDDLWKVDDSRDVCCNTCVYFSIRTNADPAPADQQSIPASRYLDMTVCNRSNDLIWGTVGANAVHFSVLQEYMAASIGCEVGVYNQFTNNLHIYTDNWKPTEWLESRAHNSNYNILKQVPLVSDPLVFDRECVRFIDDPFQDWREPFLETVAKPMCLTFRYHKERNYRSALSAVNDIRSEDWLIAAHAWILKRKENWERKQNGVSTGID